MANRLRIAVLGATGVAGQQFVAALAGHPWFELVRLAGSERSAGRRYLEALRDADGALRWFAGGEVPAEAADLLVEDAHTFAPAGLDLVFSAVEAEAARTLEPRLALHVPVISTASAFRYEPDVPILVPAVNLGPCGNEPGADHSALLAVQRRRRGWRGFIAPGPNCTTTGLVLALKPILDSFGLRRVIMTSLQACSGAGRSPGVIGLDILDNIIPFIPREEEKVETETRKILGRLGGDGDAVHLVPRALPVSCTCTRVPVLDGHTEAVFCATERPAPVEAVREAMQSFGADLIALGLPSAPPRLIEVHQDPYRPQPRLDRDAGGGMTTVVGRLRPETALGDHGVKFVLVSHNTKMGAARGALLVAESLVHRGLL
ncbi:MAG: aspartate-semialdehyde dehydrogenase [Myxococcales bacterium]|nr:aspartate-semialdehyde dehydrogenase [Myxococcota bacterium]MDW8283426.1 aspartate-semialdehyde dehydrogenase [Myxococcales bacterium]